MRKIKIICTIGPKTESASMIKKLADNGMNIARINMSHGDYRWYEKIIKSIKKINKNLRFPIGILMDTQGPEIRTSAETEVGLEEGETFKIGVNSVCDSLEKEKHTHIDHENLTNKIKKKDVVLIDDGLVALEVKKVEPHLITCKVLNKGKIGKRKSVNIPNIRLDLPALTKKDKRDIKLGKKLEVDYIAQSFVRNLKDLNEMKSFLKSIGSDASIIAKIEDQEGINNIKNIIRESDGIMVARGDLGVEIPFESIPIVQRQIVKECISQGKPVIIATHLLESMINNPRPTRAEVTDVANAIFEKADCVMLSAETTKGEYPIECVKTMHNIAKNVQKKLKFKHITELKTKDVKEAITLGACINSENLDAKAIVVFTKTGRLLSLVTKNRPNVDIFAFTENERLKNKLLMYWNTFPFKISFNEDFKNNLSQAIDILKKYELIVKKDRIIVISDITPHKKIDRMEIIEID